MVASVNTIQKVLDTILEFVDKERIPELIIKLKEIPGNKSFEDTIKRLEAMVKDRL